MHFYGISVRPIGLFCSSSFLQLFLFFPILFLFLSFSSLIAMGILVWGVGEFKSEAVSQLVSEARNQLSKKCKWEYV